MSVSAELLCSFELLKPLDSSALKSHIKKGRNKRQTMLNSPVGASLQNSFLYLMKYLNKKTITFLNRLIVRPFANLMFSNSRHRNIPKAISA